MAGVEEKPNPLELFEEWYAEAQASEANDPNAMAVASVGEDGMPSARMVLMKDFDARGFVFYTNTESRKGQQIRAHPKVALLFHWKSLGRQVRIEGDVEPVDSKEADDYFASRARQSRIGAWASDQSRPMKGRWELERRVAAVAAKYPIGEIPRPPHWSGYRVAPQMIEFWREGSFRLHDRLVYHREGDIWRTERLFP